MLPRDWLTLYGPVVPTTIAVAAGTTSQILPDPDRFLLAFWSTSVSVRIFPLTGNNVEGFGYLFPNDAVPIILTHALHGSLVNMGWNLQIGGGAANFTYLVGRMKPITPKVILSGGRHDEND